MPEMITWKDFRTDSVQAVIFTPDRSAFSAPRAVATILASSGELFNGNMQVLPIPAEVPGEIPHVLLQSTDGPNGQRTLTDREELLEMHEHVRFIETSNP